MTRIFGWPKQNLYDIKNGSQEAKTSSLLDRIVLILNNGGWSGGINTAINSNWKTSSLNCYNAVCEMLKAVELLNRYRTQALIIAKILPL